MNQIPQLDLSQLRVRALSERHSLTRAEEILVDPASTPAQISPVVAEQVTACRDAIMRAREQQASVVLIYGAHLLRNGAAKIVAQLLSSGWITHLATNGAGAIHDWEYAWHGASTESVQENVALGQFGSWDETATHLHRAIMAGALEGLGFGRSVARYIGESGAMLPEPEELAELITRSPRHPLTAARADLLRAMVEHQWPESMPVPHRWQDASILASAWLHGVPVTVHPGIGYDIISNHPVFNGAAIGRAGELDFRLIGGSLQSLEGGVVLSIGSAIMGPQVFEKSVSCVNNLRGQNGESALRDFDIFVVDIQDGGGWDWSAGEPPKTHPAYYLRFCKSYSRMGGAMRYVQSDNIAFMHHLSQQLGA